MTCIVGLVEGASVYIGGDSCAGDPTYYTTFEYTQPKVFKKRVGLEDWALFGYTTSFRMGQLLEHSFDPPAYNRSMGSPMSYLIKEFVPELREVFHSEWSAKIKHDKRTGGEFLIGLRGRLFRMQDDFSVLEHADLYAAVGCGYDYALGAMHALSRFDMNPEDRVISALEASAKFSAYVSGPFVVEHV